MSPSKPTPPSAPTGKPPRRRAPDPLDIELGRKLRLAVEKFPMTQVEFGIRLADKLGRETPFAQQHIRQWFVGEVTMRPDAVIAAEQVLGLAPGALTRIHGYLPVRARNIVTVADAIKADPALSPDQREMLLNVYRSATKA